MTFDLVAGLDLKLGLFCLALMGAMAAAYGVQLLTHNSGWADVFWSYSTGLCGAAAALYPFAWETLSLKAILISVLSGLWGMRLGSHILMRTFKGAEDARYAQLRRDWGPRFQPYLFVFLQLQALCAFPLVLSVWAAAHVTPSEFAITDLSALGIIALGLLGEALSDAQLRAYQKTAHGGVCRVGLWAYSRHPNYFFEWLVWCAYPVFALPGMISGDVNAYLTLLGPALMFHLLVNVSGIPLLEAHMVRSRGDAFRTYQAEVSAFFPWFPKRG